MPEKDYLWDNVLLKVISRGNLEMLKVLWPHQVVQSLGLTEDDYKQAIEYSMNNVIVAYLEECQRTLLPVGDATKEGTGTEEGMTAEAEADAGDVMASGAKLLNSQEPASPKAETYFDPRLKLN
ncbi:hypothetical protein PWT90_03090 [Aphanocladium album]|nr:hypothetical protein PWT90_03090 [Aphanocladium album]